MLDVDSKEKPPMQFDTTGVEPAPSNCARVLALKWTVIGFFTFITIAEFNDDSVITFLPPNVKGKISL